MSGKNPRVYVTVSDDVAKALSFLAKKEKVTVSRITLALIKEALDLREDMLDSELANRIHETEEYDPIDAEEVWRKQGLE